MQISKIKTRESDGRLEHLALIVAHILCLGEWGEIIYTDRSV